MKKKLVIIKLGGSVITDKIKRRGAFRREVVRRLIGEIVEAKKKKDFDLILIHGAGAYAHFLTTKYHIGKVYLGSKSNKGFSKVKLTLTKLNYLIWEECLRAGLTVCPVSVTSAIFTRDGEIRSFNTRLVEDLLKLGVVPLMHGDDTIDETRHIAVLSGDKTMAYLAKKFRADKVIFVSDVEGVFDKNPKVYKDAKLITQINKRNFKKIIDSMETYNINDASGEMKGKLMAIKEELKGREVQIVGGFKPEVLKKALLGNSPGTGVLF